jgi:hypothetical protein
VVFEAFLTVAFESAVFLAEAVAFLETDSPELLRAIT